jgi:hypothetical protein
MVVKRKSKEQEDDKNPIDGIRMSGLLTDMRLWKIKKRYEIFLSSLLCYSRRIANDVLE